MHASSLENMSRCRARYLTQAVLESRGDMQVLDVGGADVNGGYRSVFADPQFHYRTVDLEAGNGVDIVLDDPYRYPLDDESVDVLLSGQMLEHCEFFWLTFVEMMRVLKPDGLLFLIAPSAGHIHQYPVDCYRFYPDAYRALAKYAGCHLLEVWLDERGPWRDLVGVFSKQPMPVPEPDPPSTCTLAPVDVAPGTPEEELIQGQTPYLEVLDNIHQALQPASYLEIGVRHGRSLRLANCAATGIDPASEVADALPPTTRLIEMASDDFFRDADKDALPGPPDLAFIDGMHLFEYALRDFMHIEQLATPGTLVVIDDTHPNHVAQAQRERRTRVWTGDVWKLQRCLAEARPDLVLVELDTSPTGLLLIAGLDPVNRVLWDRYNPIVRRYGQLQGPPPEVLQRVNALDPGAAQLGVFLAELRQCREQRLPRAQVGKRLRAALAGSASAA